MKIKKIILILVMMVGASCFIVNTTVFAATCGTVKEGGEQVPYELKKGEYCCDGMVTTTIKCDDPDKDGISQLLLMAINILTASVGIAAVGGLVFGSILYTTAAGDPAKTKKGITAITNVVIGLIAFASMWAVLNFMIPGGVFK